MRGAGAIAASLLAAVALGAAFFGWLETAAPLTAQEAIEAAEDALRAAGVRGARVIGEPASGTYRPDGAEPIEVWEAIVSVDGGRIELWLAKDDGEAVFLDDRSEGGATHLLTDEEFRALSEHETSRPRDRLRRRNVALTAATTAVVVMAALLATAAPDPTRGDDR